MTRFSTVIDEDSDLSAARRVLRDHNICHLPVVHRGKLTGLLSERDTRLVPLLPEIAKVVVADVMTSHPETVAEATPVLEAVAKMATRMLGCLIVVGPTGDIVGIFSAQDALRLLLVEIEFGPGASAEPSPFKNLDDCEYLEDDDFQS